MKALRTFLLAIFSAGLLSACLQNEKLVKLKPDGSGTVEETLVLSKQAVVQMKQMAEGFGALAQGAGKSGGPAPFKLLDEAKLAEAATKMGDGVTFVSAKPIANDFGEGYTAIYAFTDINKLKLDQNPAENLAGNNPAMKLTKTKSEPVKFEFAKGAPASLTVKLPLPKDADLKARATPPPGNLDMAMAMMQQMMKDMKVTFAVEVQGRIVETNAAYQNGSRVTLMELDFNKVLENPEKFKALAQAQPKTIEEAKTLLKGIDGIKAETQPAVTIKFQ